MAKKGKRKVGAGDVATNRAASHKYEFLDKLEAGFVLRGTEVKSLRDGGASMSDSYATITDGELWLHNLHIAPYGPAARDNHEPDRDRKLLLHRRELDRISGRVRERGLTIVPTRIYFKDGKAKVEVALARGKDFYDKRQAIKSRDMKRDVDRQLREVGR